MLRRFSSPDLPASAFFDHYRDELVLRVNDPDTWRVAGWEDGPNSGEFEDLRI